MNKVRISTGCYFRQIKNIDDCIERILTHDVYGIEFSFLKTQELSDYKISSSIEKLVNTYSNSIHAPTKNVLYKNNIKSIELINKLKQVYSIYNCNNIVFHLENVVNTNFLLKEFKDYNISIENPDSKCDFDYFPKLDELLNKGFGLTLDICHALEFSKNDLEILSKKENINEVHWSFSGKYNHDSPAIILENINYALNVVKELKKPIVLEIDLRPEEKNRFIISKELELLNFFPF